MDTSRPDMHSRTVFNKTRIDMQTIPRPDTKAWKLQVWASFGTAIALAGTGLAWLPGQDLDRAFMFMGYLFTLSAAFALAKHIRDNEGRRVDTHM